MRADKDGWGDWQLNSNTFSNTSGASRARCRRRSFVSSDASFHEGSKRILQR